jgi:transposase
LESITLVGIDTGKDWLDLLINRPHSKKHRFSNDLKGIEQIKAQLGSGNYVIAIEATGRYESLAYHELKAAGFAVRKKNPKQVRRLAQGLGLQAKTDGLDAQFLADTAALGPDTQPRSKERESLGDISRSIGTLKKDRAGYLKRIQVPGVNPVVIHSYRAVVKALATEIKTLEKKFVALMKENTKSLLSERYKLALSVRGVGPVLARIAICELPEDLHAWSIRQISSYGGVAVMDNSSGKSVLPSHVPRHSNTHLKGGLYMPAVALVATQGWAKTTYARLRAKGHTHQQAIIPIMHKLLFHLIAVLKRGSPWEGEPPKRA